MALDQNTSFPVGTTGPSAAYPEGEAVNSTAPGALDGYPFDEDNINDRFGFEQALLRAGGIAASGIPDTALVSQYFQMIVELASGRAFTYDDSGIADVYVLDVQANQQAPESLFDGLRMEFIPGNTNTGAATADPFGKGVTNIKLFGGVTDPAAGQIAPGEKATLIYRTTPSVHLELAPAVPLAASIADQQAASSITVFTSPGTQGRHPTASKAWVNFNGTGVVAIRDSFNVSSITDNGVGNYTVNFTNAMANANYVAVGTFGGGDIRANATVANVLTTSVDLLEETSGVGVQDLPICNVIVLGDQ